MMSSAPPPMTSPPPPDSKSQSANIDSMANQEAYSILQRNRYTKAAQAFRNSGVVDTNGKGIPQPSNAGTGSGGVSGASHGQGASANGSSKSSAGMRPAFAGDEPLSSTEFIKRNLPQAHVASASTSGYWAGTEEFQAQALDIVNELKRQSAMSASAGGGGGEEGVSERRTKRDSQAPGKGGEMGPQMLDVTDRIKGYEKMREWVEAGLDGWKPELREILYPVFVHTFLDLIDYKYSSAAKSFFADHSEQHSIYHHAETKILSTLHSEIHILQYPLSKRFRTENYTVNLSKGGFGLLVGWLSDLGLEALWDVGKGSIRAKEAVRNIINTRIKINVADTSVPLTKIEIRHAAGLLDSFTPSNDIMPDTFNASQPLKLGLDPLDEKLKAERDYTLQQQAQAQRLLEQSAQAAPGENGEPVDEGENGIGMAEPIDLDIIEENHGIPVDAPSAAAPLQEEKVPRRAHNNFNIVDLDKEIKAVADRRKRIRLGPVVDDISASAGLKFPTSLNLPSVCAYTLFDNGEGVTSTAFSPDSSIMAAGSAESCIRVWSLKKQKAAESGEDQARTSGVRGKARQRRNDDPPVTKLIGHSGPVYSLSFDPTAGSTAPPKHVLSSSQDGSVRLWDLDQRRNLVVYKGHSDPVWDVQWGPMGVYFATASRDRTARLWITDRVTPVRIFAGHLSDVDCLTFHPNSMYLATGSSDHTCRLWDVQRGECVRVFVDHEDAVNCVAISPDGRMLASASMDNTIKLMDLHHGTVIKTMLGHTQPIQSLAFSAESSMLVSGGLDCTVRCWDVKGAGGMETSQTNGNSDLYGGQAGPETIDLLSTFKTKRTPITSVHFTPRNLCMVAGTFLEDQAR